MRISRIAIILLTLQPYSCKQRDASSDFASNKSDSLTKQEKLTRPHIEKEWTLLHSSAGEGSRSCPESIWLFWKGDKDGRFLEINEKLENGNYSKAFDRAPFMAFGDVDCSGNMPFTSAAMGVNICHNAWVDGRKLVHEVKMHHKVGVFYWKVNTGVTVSTEKVRQELEFVSNELLLYRFQIAGEEDLNYKCEYTKP